MAKSTTPHNLPNSVAIRATSAVKPPACSKVPWMPGSQSAALRSIPIPERCVCWSSLTRASPERHHHYNNGRQPVVRANIKGVFSTYKTLRDGTRATYWYHRETGERLHGDPGSPEFIADLAAAEKLIRDRLAGTFNNLVRLFTLSAEFETALAASTQTEYRRMLTAAEAEFGDMPIAALDDPRVRKSSWIGVKRWRGHRASVKRTIVCRRFRRCSLGAPTAAG